MKRYVKAESDNSLKDQVKAICDSYGYKLTKFDEVKDIRPNSYCVEMACNNGSLSIKAVGNYNYTHSDMQITPLWGRIINAKRQIDGLLEAMEVQAAIADVIGATAIN